MDSTAIESRSRRTAPLKKSRGFLSVVSLLLLVLTLQIVTLWRIGPYPANRSIPEFTGSVVEFENATTFDEFLELHDQSIVELDCRFPSTSFSDSEVNGRELEMTIRTATAVKEGEEPGYLDSTGYALLVGNDPSSSSMAGFNAGTTFIKGLYEVSQVYGTNHGYWTYQLRPVARENLR
jgi:hypothetical protein